jgi:hypothetical protein
MTKEQFSRERDYNAAISVARTLCKNGCITDKEYHKINAIFLRKYRPIIGSLQAKTT